MASVNDGSQSQALAGSGSQSQAQAQAEIRWSETEPGHVTARISGELDIVSVERLQGPFDDLLAGGPTRWTWTCPVWASWTAPVLPYSCGWPTGSARSGSTGPVC
jgi:hypothetical protein